ncbi:hypothetical protein DNTS_007197 [Danionella cerebrum]|uniref:Golgin subfamily B member 1-like n=1 Tax=Danionella cerebrum TaxID=2873325 RepID=A0A553QQZ9_9TELE|nr:hypothetical protein DNTS_007197 [Danionella translucida]
MKDATRDEDQEDEGALCRITACAKLDIIPRSAMFSRLTQGVSSVFQELSGEEHTDGDLQEQGVLVIHPQPSADIPVEDPGPSEEILDRLAQTEQLVIQLKELIREKDGQLASTQRQLKEEKEQAEVKFTKLKLQAKAKMASLNKQINEMKGQEALNSSQNSESSFQLAHGVEEELQQLKEKLSEAELSNKMLQQQLWEAEQRVREEGHAEQVQILQAVVSEKDVRFQEQILRHEQELLSQASNELELQQALRASQQRIEELEESLRSRSEVLEMLQQEVNSADQQKQILTTQFRQMELELTEAKKQREEERPLQSVEEELLTLKAKLEASEYEREQMVNALNAELQRKTTEMEETKAKLEYEEREKDGALEKLKERESAFQMELSNMKSSLESRREMSDKEQEQNAYLNAEIMKKTEELDEMRSLFESQQTEKEAMVETLKEREASFEEKLAHVKASLEREKEQAICALNVDLQAKVAELNQMRVKLQSEEGEIHKLMERSKEREASFEDEIANLKARVGMSEREKEEAISALNVDLQDKTAEFDEIRSKLESEQRDLMTKLKEQEASFQAELTKITASLESTESGKEQTISALHTELHKTAAALDETRTKLASEQREKEDLLIKSKKRETSFEEELASLEAKLQTSESEKQLALSTLNEELLKRTTEMDEMRAHTESQQREKEEMIETLKKRETSFAEELANMKVSLEARLETSESDKQTISAELQTVTAELQEMRAKLESEEKEKDHILERIKKREISFEEELNNMKTSLEARLETSESEKERVSTALNAELQQNTIEMNGLREKLANQERERLEVLEERQASFERELASLRACLEVSEKQKEQMAKELEEEGARHKEEMQNLQGKLDEVERLRAEESKSEKDRFAQTESELVYLKDTLDACQEEQKSALLSREVLEKLWMGIRTLTTSAEEAADISIPTDSLQFLEVLPALQTRMSNLVEEQQEKEGRIAQITLILQSLQGQLDEGTAEREEAGARIQELEQQLLTLQVAGESSGDHVIDSSVRDLNRTHKESTVDLHSCERESQMDRILHLEQLLADRERDLFVLRENRSFTSLKSEWDEDAQRGHITGMDSSTALSEVLECSQEDEKTLVATDTSVLSGGNDGSTELIAPHLVSPVDSKGTSSDEMVASSDSEVVHSSWTLLEAVNQDGTQEWPSQSHDFASLRLSTQSWEEACLERIPSKSSIVDIDTPSLVTHESVQVKAGSSLLSTDPNSSQAFAQVLSEEIQKRYSEVLAELEHFKDSALQEQEKVNQLEETLKVITVSKNEVESKAGIYEKELIEAKAVIEQVNLERQCVVEQIESLKDEVRVKKGQAKTLAGKLKEKEAMCSQLQQKLLDMEASLTQEAHVAKDKTSELEYLQKCLSQKNEEIMEVTESMSAKLLQVGEEKFALTSEVKKLKEQINEIETLRDDHQKLRESRTLEGEELIALQREKEDLVTQIGAMKKDGEHIKRKLQAALIQRKELLKKVAEFEKETGNKEEKEGDGNEIEAKEKQIEKLQALLQETREDLNQKEEILADLQQKISDQDQALSESQAEIQDLTKQCLQMKEQISQAAEDKKVSIESEIKTLRKQVQEATEAYEDTLTKAQEKDKVHLVQMNQLKEECSKLAEHVQAEEGEKSGLLDRIVHLEGLLATKNKAGNVDRNTQNFEKPDTNDWVQEDWVDFATAETETAQVSQPMVEQHDAVNALREQLTAKQAAHAELELRLQESQDTQALNECKFTELYKELDALKEKERYADALTKEVEALREKSQRAEAHVEKLKSEVDEAWEAAKRSISKAESPIKALQSEVEECQQFLKCKNEEIVDLSQQLGEQQSLLMKMQETVKEKDLQIASLQEELKAEQARVPLREEEEKGNCAKIQQLQRKLQAALVSRKEALKEKQVLKEEQAAAEKVRTELLQKLDVVEMELSKTKEEREKLIEELDRTLLENQNLSASCESLKLAMEGVLNEKETCKRQVEIVKEESEQLCRQLEEKVHNMKEEYESLLKSYENVSDEAERVRKVLEAARQERQELATKARAHEAAKQEAERLADEATKEVEVVKDKMRKFAKVKHQKIMELEEENEKLREQEESKQSKRLESELQQELESIKQEFAALKTNYSIALDERNSLEHEAEQLRQRLTEEIEKKAIESQDLCTVETVMEVNVIEQAKHPDLIESEQSVSAALETVLTMPAESIGTALDQDQRNTEILAQTVGRLKELEVSLEKAENNIKELEAALEANVQSNNEQESLLNSELASVKQQLKETLERERTLIEDVSRKDRQLEELRSTLEAEKDDLEERLMNQLAQLNGSIAGYQQEAFNGRERLTELQREMEKLERERAELEAEVASERDRACRMEEDMRQAHRERAEAEAESGKQRELEQKLKSAQRFKEGSQNRARQLEELLREKQLEVRQLQKDCIAYQERISELAKEVKSMMLARDEANATLEAARSDIEKILQDRAGISLELSTCKGKLDLALEELKQAQTDKLAAERMVEQKESELKADAERTLDEVRYRLGAELKQMELRLEKSYLEREREEEATLEARSVAEAADKHSRQMQARLDEALARLAAFSRSMSSLQDDRDRVLDEAKQWENRFHSELQEKESDVRAAETRAKELAEQLLSETTQKEELQKLVERMQKAEENQHLEFSDLETQHNKSLASFEVERQDLQEKLTLAETALTQAHSQLTALESEAEGLRNRAKALEAAVDRLQTGANEAHAVIKEREVEERRLCLILEQLETDLGSSKNLTETLQVELDEKEKREMALLGEKEQAVTQAVEEARKDADARAEMAEKELEQRRAELRGLEERLRKAEEDSFQSKAQLESFTKAMGSLQVDRDRVLSHYKQLEEKHLQVMMEKDSLIQEAAGENNKLKEELRALFSQRDDLNAENAKLAAQLHGYRNDLNQVLVMKDSQHKLILSSQVERIGFLEREKQELKIQLQTLEKEVEQARGPPLEQELFVQASEGVDVQHAPEADVEKLREQLQSAGKLISTLKESLESEKETQVVQNKELKELRWESGILRSEAETAEERVAELARDLLRMEQQLLEEREVVSQLQAQNLSFGQAMSSLQDSRDQAVTEAQELRLHLDEINRSSQPAASPSDAKGEVWSLKNALAALQNDRERMLEQLHVQRFEMDRLMHALEEERRRGVEQEEKIPGELSDSKINVDKQELEMLRLERLDWQGQAELFKQQTLMTLSDRDQQIRHLTALLEEAQASKLQQEHTQRQGRLALDAAPGGPLEHNEGFKSECIELQRRLEEESEQRLRLEEQLAVAQDRLKRYTQGDWQTSSMSETAVLIEPPEGAVTRTRSGGVGLLRMLRVAFCSRQRTPLLVSLYLLTVHLLLLLCMGGFL